MGQDINRQVRLKSRPAGIPEAENFEIVEAKVIQRKVTETDLPISTSLGVLGLNGLTAYFGLQEIGQPKTGETVVVSTAAGAVGSCVGQIAKIKGCRKWGQTLIIDLIGLYFSSFQIAWIFLT